MNKITEIIMRSAEVELTAEEVEEIGLSLAMEEAGF
jgi:hypothetical protein